MKILIIDHHELPDGIAPLLQRLAPRSHGFAILESASVRDGTEYCASHDVDLVLIDLANDGAARLKAIDTLIARHPQLRVAALVNPGDTAMAAEALGHGACGCIEKTSAAESFVAALQPLLPLQPAPPKRQKGAFPLKTSTSV